MITQEEGQENLQVEVKETGGSQHPWPVILIPALALDFLKHCLKKPVSLCWPRRSRAVYITCLMWSNVTALLSIIFHLRNRWWSHNKLRIQGSSLFRTCFVLLVDVSVVRGLGRRYVSMDRIHWAVVSLISLLPAPWKTLERRTCLVTMFTEFRAFFQCLLENSQLNVETGTILMLGFWFGSSQSMEVYTILFRVQEGYLQNITRLKSVSFLEFCHFTHYLNCSSDFMMQENMDKADLSTIKGGKLCQISTWINEFSRLTSVSLVR